jgi:hypothetical protein
VGVFHIISSGSRSAELARTIKQLLEARTSFAEVSQASRSAG